MISLLKGAGFSPALAVVFWRLSGKIPGTNAKGSAFPVPIGSANGFARPAAEPFQTDSAAIGTKSATARAGTLSLSSGIYAGLKT
jgi:hypothetical protein